MMGRDLVRPDPERHGALRMTDAARPILRGEAGITLRRDTLQATPDRPAVKTLVCAEDEPLLSALKAKRRALAEAARVPAYVIFADRTLIEMAERRPQTLDQMAGITGIGAKKLESFGAIFLAVITGEEPDPMHPSRRKLAGRDTGTLYDRLLTAQADLMRGDDGTHKPMSCPANLIAKLAEQRPRDLDALTRLLGDRRAERFGAAFLSVLNDE
jgi:ATP-dependent DNA helicase RecQ